MPVVLFPSMPLPLQVFGDRDKDILQRCHDEGGVFGTALVRNPVALGEGHTLYEIGTTARIAGANELVEGRLNVLAIGQERFRVIEWIEGTELPEATVELLDQWDEEQRVSSDLVANAAHLFKEYVDLLLALAGQKPPDPVDLPQDGMKLSYLVAQSLAIAPEEKQGLLEMDSVSARLDQELTILRRENSSNRLLLSFRDKTGRGKVSDGLFSLN